MTTNEAYYLKAKPSTITQKRKELWNALMALEKQEAYTIRSPQDIAQYVHKYRKKNKEHFLCVLLNGNHAPIKVDVVSIGLLNKSLVHPREVFRKAIASNAAAIALVHNHPSGCVNPSKEDIEVTKRLVEVGHLVGIPVLDHVIISSGDLYSFCENGIAITR